MRIPELLAHIRERGGDLRAAGDRLEYVGAPEAMTDELRATIRERKPAILAFLRTPREALPPADAHLGARSIPTLLALLADRGIYVALTPEGPELRQHPGADPENADQAVVDELNSRIDELVAFLRKSSADMSAAELRALGFQRGPGGVVMLAADAPEFEGGWSPPPGWGREARDAN